MLTRVLAARIGQLAPDFDIRLALVFGSAVSGQMHGRSDLDLAVLLGNADIDFARFAELEHQLQLAIPERRLDLSIINRADPLFLWKITESCTLVYGKETDLQRLKLYAFRFFQDHKRFLELERRYVRRFLEELSQAP